MKKFNKLLGYRSNKKWKMILASCYYIFGIIFFLSSIFEVPEIKVNMYDMLVHKTSMILFGISFLIPAILFSNFKIRDRIPLFKKNKWWSNTLGFIVIFLITILCSDAINLFHSKDYKERYDNYYSTKIIYTSQESDEVSKNDESSLSNEELKDNFESLTEEKKENNEKNDNSNKNEIIKDDVKEEETTNKNVTNNTTTNNNTTPNNNDVVIEKLINMKVHYIDVGQGDSTFIELPNNKTMLIDAGESSKGQVVANYIKSLGYSKIDYLVGTHPHTDHIGGLAYIINNFTIGNIYIPKAVSTSKTYENLLNTISQKGLKVITAKAGVNILNDSSLKIDIIAPNSDYYSDLNNYSAVIKLTYGNRKFLFMGDAEIKSENEIMTDVSADVIKIGHHGSDTSSGQSFVNKVKAKYVVIMVGNNNQYSHPYQTTIDRWKNIGATIYRTDLNGTIVITTDGTNIEIKSTR